MASDATKRSYLGHDARRAQILAVAARQFSEQSYDTVSTVAIAREAGIARGLVHHYFGTKRDLYVEVLRRMLTIPEGAFGHGDGAPPVGAEAVVAAIDRWIDTIDRNRQTWLAAVSAQAPGLDEEVDAILAESRARIDDQLIALAWGSPVQAPPELRALIRGYGGFAQALTIDWLQRGEPSRAALHHLLLQTLLALVGDVLPRVQSDPKKAAETP